MMAVSILLDTIRPKHIIEFGTGAGGLSIFIGIWAKINGANFRTYDSSDQRYYGELFNALKIEYICYDIFHHVDEIFSHIQQPGVTLVLCDNGDKHRELQTFSQGLKIGDFIMMHDYAKNQDVFTQKITPHYWDWHESSEQIALDAGLVPVYEKLLEYGAWGCFRKDKECLT